MSRYIDADILIEDLEYDVKIDQDSLDHEDLSDINRNLIQTDKDIKQNAIDILKHTPTADVAPVIHAKLLNPNPYGSCSNCNYLIDIREGFNYCPKCGAMLKINEVTE